MGRLKRAYLFLFSKTVAAGILGFLLSLLGSEVLYAVPRGMELDFAEILTIPILVLMIYVLGFFDEAMRHWWEWRRFRSPIKAAVLNGYMDDSKGIECKPMFSPFSTKERWLDFFKEAGSDKKFFDANGIDWSAISSKYAVLLNPFGEVYLEKDKRKLLTFERIKEFVADGGIFCCTGGFPFYYYWDAIIGQEMNSTPRTRIASQQGIHDTRLFPDSLVTTDFGVVILNDPQSPTPAQVYQEKKPDIEFFGDLGGIGGSNTVSEFRSPSGNSRGLVPGLRVRHSEGEEKFPLAAISYGQGYLIIAGMNMKSDVEFAKLSMGICNFVNQIAKRRKSKV